MILKIKELYICCLDSQTNLPKIHVVEVIDYNDKYLFLKQPFNPNEIAAISNNRYDVILLSLDSRTNFIPIKAISDNTERGYVYKHWYEAFERLKSLSKQKYEKALELSRESEVFSEALYNVRQEWILREKCEN